MSMGVPSVSSSEGIGAWDWRDGVQLWPGSKAAGREKVHEMSFLAKLKFFSLLKMVPKSGEVLQLLTHIKDPYTVHSSYWGFYPIK